MSEIKEVANELIGLERSKIFRTVRSLTTHPGQLISEYSQGEKQKYLSPVYYFFGISSLVFYLNSLTPHNLFMVPAWGVNILRDHFGIDFTSEKVKGITYIFFNETYRNIILIPIMMITTWVVFRKHNKSFKDNSWFFLYTAGHTALLGLIPFLGWFITKSESSMAVIILSQLSSALVLIYSIWAAKQFYLIKLGRAFFLIVLRKFLSIFILAFICVLIMIVYNHPYN